MAWFVVARVLFVVVVAYSAAVLHPLPAGLPANVVFGPTGIPSSNYDLANFAWVTSPDPAGFVSIWGCGGESNYMNYCNRKATGLLEKSDTTLDPKSRASLLSSATTCPMDLLFSVTMCMVRPHNPE